MQTLEQAIKEMTETYAKTTDEDYEDIMLAYVRVAYGLGYINGLKQRVEEGEECRS